MNGIRVATAALRWHAANEARLEAGRRKKNAADAAKNRSIFGFEFTLLKACEKELAEAKRMERMALRALKRECIAVRKEHNVATEGMHILKLPQPEFINV